MESNKSFSTYIIFFFSSSSILVSGDELNEEITKKMKKEEKYQTFLKWAFSNGLKIRNVNFENDISSF